MRILYLNFFLLSLLCVTGAQATSFDDIGYTRLKAELGVNLPDGTGVKIAQIEFTDGSSWIPNLVAGQFTSITFTEKTTGSTGSSLHATEVGKFFYGNVSSTSRGITEVDLYETNDWLFAGFLKAGMGVPPNIQAARLANHSWTADAGAGNVIVLSLVDYVVDVDEFIQVVGMIADPITKHLLVFILQIEHVLISPHLNLQPVEQRHELHQLPLY